MWVASHPQEAVMWAELLLGCFFCRRPSSVCTWPYKEGWLHTVFVSEVNLCVDSLFLCVWQKMAQCLKCFCNTWAAVLLWNTVWLIFHLLSFGGFNFWRSFDATHSDNLHGVARQNKLVPFLNMFMSRKQIGIVGSFVSCVKGKSSYCWGAVCEDLGTFFLPQLVFVALWPLHHPLFALTLFYLPQQVEDRDYLEKVSELRHQMLCILLLMMQEVTVNEELWVGVSSFMWV